MYFLQICFAYAAAYGYSQFPEHGGKIMATHLLCAFGADVSKELHGQKREADLEQRMASKYGKDRAA